MVNSLLQNVVILVVDEEGDEDDDVIVMFAGDPHIPSVLGSR